MCFLCSNNNLGNRSLSKHIVSYRCGSQNVSTSDGIAMIQRHIWKHRTIVLILSYPENSAPRTDDKAETCHIWNMCWDLPPTRIPVEVHSNLYWVSLVVPGGWGDSCRLRSGVDALDWTSWLGRKWPSKSWYTGRRSYILIYAIIDHVSSPVSDFLTISSFQLTLTFRSWRDLRSSGSFEKTPGFAVASGNPWKWEGRPSTNCRLDKSIRVKPNVFLLGYSQQFSGNSIDSRC